MNAAARTKWGKAFLSASVKAAVAVSTSVVRPCASSSWSSFWRGVFASIGALSAS